MDTKHPIFFVVIYWICCSIHVRFASGMNTKERLAFFEERYDVDYTRTRAEIRQIWGHLADQQAACCSNQTDGNSQSHTISDDTDTLQELIGNAKTYLNAVKKGVHEEKRFSREALRVLEDKFKASLINVEQNVVEEIKELTNTMDDLLSRMKDQEKDTSTIIAIIHVLLGTNAYSLMLNMHRHEATGYSSKAASCIDIAQITTVNGIYTVFNQHGQPIRVYCSFDESTGKGYTYLSTETFYELNTFQLHNVFDHFQLTYRGSDGRQFNTRIEQIERFSSRPLSVQFNEHIGYTGHVNTLMGPYLFVGLTPEFMRHDRGIQGYKANNVDYTFKNCDGNPNGYFAFLFNHNGKAEVSKYSSAIANKWAIGSKEASGLTRHLPNEFFSKFELHFGGCGAYASSKYFHSKEAALGIPFVITCLRPRDVYGPLVTSLSTTAGIDGRVPVGTVLTYSCTEGKLIGSTTRRCLPIGSWSGETQVCLPDKD